MENEFDVYNLSQSIYHHKNTLRSITSNSFGLVVTGSYDKTCAYLKKELGIYNFIKDTKYHDDYIYVVRSVIDSTGFLSGSKDSKIILMDNEGNPLSNYIGHSQTVNSISQYDRDNFISGSWDATARVWDLESGKCKYVLKDHSHAVATCALENSRYITGSQDKKIKFWDKDRLVNVIDNAHDDIIRDIIINDDMNSFYTCSNDFTIKLWTLSGNLVQTMTGHDGFIFRLMKRNGLLFSAGDDKLVKLWKDGKCTQDLLHPNTVWDMTIDKDEELITACGDGIIRVFSHKPDRWLPQNELDEYINLCLFTENKQESNEHVDINKLPLFQDASKIKAKEGEIRVFNNGGIAEAYLYKENRWDKIGEVLGTKNNKKYYPGDNIFAEGEYDFIFDVDLEGKTSKLPINNGDNCLVEAEKFIARENLHKLYLDDITKFLRQNTKQENTPSKKEVKTKKIECSIPFPQNQHVTYININTDGPLKKITELNSLVGEELVINLDHLKALLDKIQKTQYYHSSTFSENDINIIIKLLKWPNENQIPILDTLRMLLIHPASNSFFYRHSDYIFTKLFEILKNSSEINKILVIRIFNNMFIDTNNKLIMKKKIQEIIESVGVYLDSQNNNLKSGLVSLLFNYSIELSNINKNEIDSSVHILTLINEILINEKENKNIKTLLLAIGNLIYDNEYNRTLAKDMDIASNIKELEIQIDENASLLNEIKNYFINILK